MANQAAMDVVNGGEVTAGAGQQVPHSSVVEAKGGAGNPGWNVFEVPGLQKRGKM